MEKQLVIKKLGIEEMYQESKEWLSHLNFMADEIVFFDNLLNSYVFEPDTPSLFEDLQKYQDRLKKSKKLCSNVIGDVVEHENKLGGLLEILHSSLDKSYQTIHQQFRGKVEDCLNDFRRLKTDLYAYASGILKKRHKKD